MNKSFLLPALLFLTGCSDNASQTDATGVFEATEVTVSARQAGELLSLDVEEGQALTAGSVVGTIDSTLLTLQRRQLRANISATDARRLDTDRQVAALRQQWDNLRHERTRFAALVADKAAPRKQLDDIEQQMAVVQRQMAAQQSQLAAANLSLSAQSNAIVEQIAQLDHQIGNCRITAPITGTVVATFAEKGEYTALRLGQKVTVYADQGAKAKKAYPGTLVWIADKAEFTPRTIQTRDERANLVYAVKVRVLNDGLIKRGMYGEVRFAPPAVQQ